MLEEKICLVTGASRGIGLATSKVLAQNGAVVYANARVEGCLDTLALEAKSECGGRIIPLYFDVTDVSAVKAAIVRIKTEQGRLDVLVNNAGITRDGLMVRMSEEDYDRVIAVNQKSVFNLMKLVGAVMFKQRSGRIINLSSVAGVHGNAGQVNYSASKAAVIGMTLAAAKELAPRGITVNAIAPGFIETPMTDELSEAQKAAILERISMKRYGKPEEVAGLVSFLAGDDSAYITGQVIEISGGLVI
jgi:3-oxoacyl-[acyl-carrier protein] reductase